MHAPPIVAEAARVFLRPADVIMPEEPTNRPSDLPRRRPRYAGTHPRRFEERYKERDPQRYPEIVEHVRAQGRTPAGTHVPVMLAEVLAALRPAPGEIVADVTLGYGGHARALLERVAPGGVLIGLDLDGEQLLAAGRRLSQCADSVSLHLRRSHFAGLPKVMADLGIEGLDVLLADLGVSSMQIDDPARGFSYRHDGPLDMRMDPRRPRTAADLLRSVSEAELSEALRDFADEPGHARIARAIVQRRERQPITRTLDLAEIVVAAAAVSPAAARRASGMRGERLHPAARTFQALRILVNDELHGLEQLLRIAPWCMRPGGRLGVLTFHSGEDRRVKRAFREGVRGGVYERIADRPERAAPAERAANPRSAPAKLRWAVVSTKG